MTRLCVPIFVTDAAGAAESIRAAADAGADSVELRLDRMTAPLELTGSPLPIIFTCRPTWEGGFSTLTDVDRLHLVAESAQAIEQSMIDVELETWRRLGGNIQLPRPIVVSAHDFITRPARLHNILIEMDAIPAAVNKIVWQARTIRDNLEAFEILNSARRPTIALCMGEAGLISRLLAGKFGAYLTFASLTNGSGTAPGQPRIEEIRKLYRWGAVGKSTQVYGVIAHPVGHSMSPAIHNAAFTATGHDAVYVPLLVDPGYESFKAFMESALALPGFDLSGISVTLPHKENALRYLQWKGAEIEELAARIGAVNTIIIGREGNLGSPRLSGINTDYAAILDSITDRLGSDRKGLRGCRAAVLGAGGTGRTAVAALAHCGAEVVIVNRTVARARELAREFDNPSGAKVRSVEPADLARLNCEILINCTSVGMSPNVDASPLDDCPSVLRAGMLVFDTIYNPMKTRLLAQAESAGAKTIGGVEMFIRQAAGQFSAWTGQLAPREIMRGVIEERLARSSS